MASIIFEVLFILLLVVANGVFAMSEMAVVSARKVRLQQWANEGNTNARTALELANAPTRFLSTVQVGITLIGILAGALGGATIAKKLALLLSQIRLLAPYSQAIGLGIVVVSITYLSLIIGELVPKRVALNNPERIAATIATPMRALSALASPVVHLLSTSTEVALRLLGIKPSLEPQVTEEEIRVLIKQGTEAGTFEVAEQDMVQRVFRLGDRQVSGLMTPRLEIVWLDLEDLAENNRHKMTHSAHSRFPVCQGGLDNVIGVVQVKDLLARSLAGEVIDLTAALQTPLFVPESMPALNVLELFKQSGTHTALVVDEYGVVQGLVTLNDILEAIVGDIPSVDELAEPQVVQREDGSWLLDGLLPVEDFFELFNIQALADEQRGNYQTLGGFVTTHLGRIPAAADHFEWRKLRFEVMDMDGNRVDKVLIMPISINPPDLPS